MRHMYRLTGQAIGIIGQASHGEGRDRISIRVLLPKRRTEERVY